MNKQGISSEIREVIDATHYSPAISVIIPFEPKMNARSELTQQLKFASDKVGKELNQNYPPELVQVVMQKLTAIIKNLDFSTYRKSIAIFVSPLFEKVLYLDVPVEERVIVTDSFEIKDLVYAKKENHRYLVLMLGGKNCKVYIGNTNSFVKVKSNVPDHITDFVNDAPERVSNFSDPSERKEIILKKFLQERDHGLSYLVQTYQLPVFVIGSKKVTGYFKGLTKNEKSIVGYIHGNYEDATSSELKEILNPYIGNWKEVKTKDLLNKIEKAANAGKLSSGIKEVWKQVTQKKGKLLVVEKNYVYAAEKGIGDSIIYDAIEPGRKFAYIKDAVDDVIEKILSLGGDVEFVDDDTLKDYQRIALIQYYS